MFAKLICNACGADLSRPVRIHSSKDPAFLVPEIELRKPFTSPGDAIKSWEPIQRSYIPNNPAELEFTPQYWLNPADVDFAIKPVKDGRKLNGCCGLAGLDGPNMRCKECGTAVGTRQSDCCTADVFIPEPAATQWIEVVE